jgi:aromatic ring-opening dioxygenase LigB subunit
VALSYAAIVPHPPLLIPTIGKENVRLLNKTATAYKKIEQDLYAIQPDTIIIISPHGDIQTNSFSLNLCPEYYAQFEEFGDLATKIKYSGDVMLAHKIREDMETKAPLQLVSDVKLDYGCSVPLYNLAANLPKIKIIPIYYSGLGIEAHYNFGLILKKEFLITNQKIAVIASGDLSHKLMRKSPAGYSPKAKKFDIKLIDNLLKGETAEILSLDHNLISEVSECGLKAIIILLGILDGTNYTPQLLNYEFPFGVGYLTMKMKL